MYVDGIMNYAGSKYKLLDQIIPHLDTTKETFVDLFAGGGSVYTNVVHLYKNIIVNDIIRNIIEIQEKLILDDTNEFFQSVKSMSVPCKTSQEEYNRLRESYNQNKSPEKLYALMLSCTNNLMRFNKSMNFNQTWGKRCLNNNTEKKIKNFVEHLRPEFNRINFISMSFDEVPFIKDSMYYIDSPYTGSEAGYSALWKKDDDIKLYDYCKELDKNGQSFMLSGILGEHNRGIRWELIDKLITDGYNYKILDCNYEKVARIKKIKNSSEVIIMNY